MQKGPDDPDAIRANSLQLFVLSFECFFALLAWFLNIFDYCCMFLHTFCASFPSSEFLFVVFFKLFATLRLGHQNSVRYSVVRYG